MKLEQDIIDPTTFVQEQLKQIDSERAKLEQRMEKLEVKLNHTVRARREHEVPLLLKQYEKKKGEDKAYWEEQRRQYIIAHEAAHKQELKEKERVLKNETRQRCIHSAVNGKAPRRIPTQESRKRYQGCRAKS